MIPEFDLSEWFNNLQPGDLVTYTHGLWATMPTAQRVKEQRISRSVTISRVYLRQNRTAEYVHPNTGYLSFLTRGKRIPVLLRPTKRVNINNIRLGVWWNSLQEGDRVWLFPQGVDMEPLQGQVQRVRVAIHVTLENGSRFTSPDRGSSPVGTAPYIRPYNAEQFALTNQSARDRHSNPRGKKG